MEITMHEQRLEIVRELIWIYLAARKAGAKYKDHMHSKRGQPTQ
jgi:hypothetical protein